MDDEKSIESLIDDLWSSNPEIRQNATKTLIEMGQAAVHPLFTALEKDDYNAENDHYENGLLRQVFVQIGEPSFQAVIKALELKNRKGRATVKILASFDDPRAVPVLIGVMCDESFGVNTRMYAINGLGLFKDERAFEPLIEILRDRDVLIRGRAAWALARYNDPRALKPLRIALWHWGSSQWMDWRAEVKRAIKLISDSQKT